MNIEKVHVESITREKFDLEDIWNIHTLFNPVPDYIINAAGYTDVNKAEEQTEKCRILNADVPKEIARQCEKWGVGLLHISSGQIFDGKNKVPYREYHIPNALSHYARQKIMGEKVVQFMHPSTLILRVGDIYDNRNSILNKLYKMAGKVDHFNAYIDRMVGPTSTDLVGRIIGKIIEGKHYDHMEGIYHLACQGGASSLRFLSYAIDLMVKEYNMSPLVINPISCRDAKEVAPRPRYSIMNSELIENEMEITLPNWDDELESFIKKYKLES